MHHGLCLPHKKPLVLRNMIYWQSSHLQSWKSLAAMKMQNGAFRQEVGEASEENGSLTMNLAGFQNLASFHS
jgi:hypothetical protein